MQCVVMQFNESKRASAGRLKGAANGAISRRKTAIEGLLERLKAGTAAPYDRVRTRQYAKLDGKTESEWCEAHGVPLVPYVKYSTAKKTSGDGRRALMLERTVREASAMLGQDRWIVAALLIAGGHLSPTDF